MAEGEQSVGSSTGNTDRNEPEVATFYPNRAWRMNLLFGHHSKYCRKILFNLSSMFEEYDTQRVTFLHFAITSLDILNCIRDLSQSEIDTIRKWIYFLQITTEPGERCGFQGSSTFLIKNSTSKTSEEAIKSEEPSVDNDLFSVQLPSHLYSSHVTMTYAALVTLLTIGDDLSKVDRKKILLGIAALQNKDGSFQASLGCGESDMRFVYCAVCTCYILNDFSSINVPLLVNFITSSFTYEGSFGSGVGTEGHAAYTYCAVASLYLLGQLHSCLSPKQIRFLTRWCLFRQEYGFTGRPNKSEDTCYSYWVGATLKLLDSLDLTDRTMNVDFILSNQNPLTGGIGKSDNTFPDPLHTFMGLAGLSLVNYEGLNSINPALTMSENAVLFLITLQAQWKKEEMLAENRE